MTSEKILDISWGTILKIFIVVICIAILSQIHHILVWFVFALIISTLVIPIIDFLTKFRIPRVLAVIFIYFFGILGILGLTIYLTADLLLVELHALIEYLIQVIPQLPYYFDKIEPYLGEFRIEAFIEGLYAPETILGILYVLFAIFGGFWATIFILIISFFLSLEKKGMEKVLSLLFSKKDEAYVLSLWSRCQRQISGWFFTRILGCLFVGVVCFLAFYLLDIGYPFSLALMAGILNFIPFIGSFVSGAIIFIVIALENPFQAIFVLIIFILIQQVENNIIMPALVKKFIGLPPVLVLFALTVGGTLWGFLGAILAIPLTGILFEFFKEFLQKRREEKTIVL